MYKKKNGFSFYDIVISLVILVFASLFITKIFVGSVELQNSNKITSICTFEAIETLENIKTLENISIEDRNDYLRAFDVEQNNNSSIYSKDIDVLGKTYREIVTISVVDSNYVNKVRSAKIYNSDEENEIDYEKIVSDLLRADVTIYDEDNSEVYTLGTYFTKSYKELD